MKKAIMTGLMVLAVAGLSLAAPSASLRKLTVNEAAEWGATHAVTFRYTDFATYTGTNGTYYTNNTAFPVTAKQQVTCVGMVLAVPFEYTTTNGLSSIVVEVGDGTDQDLFLTSTEINNNNTPIYAKAGRLGVGALSQSTGTFLTNQTPSTVEITTRTYTAAGTAFSIAVPIPVFTNGILQSMTTNTYSVLTNAAVTLTPSATAYTVLTNQAFTTHTALITDTLSTTTYGTKVYTAADTVDFVFTPTGTEWSLSQCNKGEVTFFFKILDGAKRP
jgi:hypothetical protein